MKRTALSVVAALCIGGYAGGAAAFDDILFDPDGTGPAGAEFFSNISLAAATGFAEGIFTTSASTVDDGFGGTQINVSSDPNGFWLNVQGYFAGFEPEPDIPDNNEFTWQLRVQLDTPTVSANAQEITWSALDVINPEDSVFKIWYDGGAPGDGAGNSDASEVIDCVICTLQGTGDGLDGTGADIAFYGPDLGATYTDLLDDLGDPIVGGADLGFGTCDKDANDGASNDGSVLVACGRVIPLLSRITFKESIETIDHDGDGTTDELVQRSSLDNKDDDNYDGLDDTERSIDGGNADETWTDGEAIGTVVGTGGMNMNIGIEYQNFDFFKSVITEAAVDANLNTNTTNPFSQANPSSKVLGVAWDVGDDQEDISNVFFDNEVKDFGTRTMNNFACLDADDASGLNEDPNQNTCDFVFQHSGTASFTGYVVPEPGTMALLGLGLAGIGAARRKKA